MIAGERYFCTDDGNRLNVDFITPLAAPLETRHVSNYKMFPSYTENLVIYYMPSNLVMNDIITHMQ